MDQVHTRLSLTWDVCFMHIFWLPSTYFSEMFVELYKILTTLWHRKTENGYTGTTWQIKFKLDKVDGKGIYKLRLAIASATLAEVQVKVSFSCFHYSLLFDHDFHVMRVLVCLLSISPDPTLSGTHWDYDDDYLLLLLILFVVHMVKLKFVNRYG